VITQTTNQILDIFYYIYFLYGAGTELPEAAVRNLCASSHSYRHDAYSSICQLPNMSTGNYKSMSVGAPMNNLGSPDTYKIKTIDFVNKYTNYVTNYTPSYSRLTGSIIRGVQLGYSSRWSGTSECPLGWDNVNHTNMPNIKRVFGHSANSKHPCFESLFKANGGGVVTLSGNSDREFPTVYKINIVEGGAVGTAKYYLQAHTTTGHEGNTYIEKGQSCPYISKELTLPLYPTAKDSFGLFKNNLLCNYLKDQVVVVYAANAGFTILNVINGAHINTPVTVAGVNIKYLTTVRETNQFYLGCPVTGVYIANASTGVYSQYANDPCYGLGWNDVDGVLYRIGAAGIYEGANSNPHSISSNNLLTQTAWSDYLNLYTGGNSQQIVLLRNDYKLIFCDLATNTVTLLSYKLSDVLYGSVVNYCTHRAVISLSNDIWALTNITETIIINLKTNITNYIPFNVTKCGNYQFDIGGEGLLILNKSSSAFIIKTFCLF
jgi:hypothetical protein